MQQDETILRRRAYNLRTGFRLLHISESQGYALIKAGKIKVVRLGPASPRITEHEIERLLRDGIPNGDRAA